MKNFWKQLGSTLAFGQSRTTTAHQQESSLAGKNKPTNRVVPPRLCEFEQKNLDVHLDLFEFNWNNSKHAVTAMALFHTDQEYLQNLKIKEEEPGKEIASQSAAIHAAKFRHIMTELKKIMTSTNQTISHHYKIKHKDISFRSKTG